MLCFGYFNPMLAILLSSPRIIVVFKTVRKKVVKPIPTFFFQWFKALTGKFCSLSILEMHLFRQLRFSLLSPIVFLTLLCFTFISPCDAAVSDKSHRSKNIVSFDYRLRGKFSPPFVMSFLSFKYSQTRL